MLDLALGLLDDHLGNLDVAGLRLVEGRTHDLAANGSLHVGDLFGALVDQQHDQMHVRMVGGDRICDGLQQHRLAGTRRGDDERPLALAQRRDQIHGAAAEVLLDRFQAQTLLGVVGREIVKVDSQARGLGVGTVQGVNAH